MLCVRLSPAVLGVSVLCASHPFILLHFCLPSLPACLPACLPRLCLFWRAPVVHLLEVPRGRPTPALLSQPPPTPPLPFRVAQSSPPLSTLSLTRSLFCLPPLFFHSLFFFFLHALFFVSLSQTLSLSLQVPATREVLGSLPNVFSALCLNARGLHSFVQCQPFERLFKVLLSPDYLPAMRRRRSSDPLGEQQDSVHTHTHTHVEPRSNVVALHSLETAKTVQLTPPVTHGRCRRGKAGWRDFILMI